MIALLHGQVLDLMIQIGGYIQLPVGGETGGCHQGLAKVIAAQEFQRAHIGDGVCAAVQRAGQHDQLQIGAGVGLGDDVEVAGYDGGVDLQRKHIQKVHGGGTGVHEQRVPVVHQGGRLPYDGPLGLCVQLGPLGEEGDLLLLYGADTAIDLLHGTGLFQKGHVCPNGVHGYMKGLT